jgi:choline kinase
VQVGDRYILEHILEAITGIGISHIVLVTGHASELLQEYFRQDNKFRVNVDYVHNPRFDETNNIYSVMLTEENLKGRPFLMVNSDVLFDPYVVRRVAETDGEIVLAVDTAAKLLEEEMKVTVGAGGKVTAIGKWIDPFQAHAEFLGIARFTETGSSSFYRAIQETIRDQGEQVFYERALNRLASEQFPIDCVDVAGSPWVEVDDHYDLDLARKDILRALLARFEDQNPHTKNGDGS